MQKMQKLEIREGNKRTGHSSNSRFSPSACDAKNYDTLLDNVYHGHGCANTPIKNPWERAVPNEAETNDDV